MLLNFLGIQNALLTITDFQLIFIVYNHKLDNSGYVPSIVPTSPTVPVIDPEDLEPKNFSFNDQSVRRAFIRKVYLILMVSSLIVVLEILKYSYCRFF